MTNHPIPEGDRFKDDSLFRLIGTGAADNLYECWESAIRKYVEKCVEAERDACVKACEDIEVHDVGHPGTAFAVQGMCINAIRARNNKGAE